MADVRVLSAAFDSVTWHIGYNVANAIGVDTQNQYAVFVTEFELGHLLLPSNAIAT